MRIGSSRLAFEPVRRTTTATIVGCGKTIPVEFKYVLNDPLAVRLTFRQEPQDEEWVFARDLLVEALGNAGEAGHGDVQAHAWKNNQLAMSFSSAVEEDQTVVVSTVFVQEFVDETFKASGDARTQRWCEDWSDKVTRAIADGLDR